MKKIWDVNGAVGGPVLKDRLWFFTAVRSQGNRKTVSIFKNANENDLNAWHYVRSTEQATDDGTWKNANVRLTLSGDPEEQVQLLLGRTATVHVPATSGGNATDRPTRSSRQQPRAAPCAAGNLVLARPRTGSCSKAAVGSNRIDGYGVRPNISNFNKMIPVPELCTAGCASNGGIQNLAYRSNQGGGGTPSLADSDVYSWRAAALLPHRREQREGRLHRTVHRQPLPELHPQLTSGSPTASTTAFPHRSPRAPVPSRFDTELRTDAFYVQDQWTSGRLTLSGALRFDHTSGLLPRAARIGPHPHIPVARVIPAQDGTSYSDITPRMGAVYDLFGDGKTALKVQSREGTSRRPTEARLPAPSPIR